MNEKYWKGTLDNICKREQEKVQRSPVEHGVMCHDCNGEMDPPFDNGDAKMRCEACAVKKYENDCGPKSMRSLFKGQKPVGWTGA